MGSCNDQLWSHGNDWRWRVLDNYVIMPIAINGSGTITGLSQGGLPANSVTTATCNFSPGKVLKVQTAEKTASQAFATVYTLTDVTDLSISYTPIASDSKLYVDADINIYIRGNNEYHGMAKFALLFDGTQQGEEDRVLGGYGATASYLDLSWRHRLQRVVDSWSGGSAKIFKIQARNETNSGQPCTINSEPGHSWLKITEVAA